ncbi:MAG: glycosyltransferase family 4 protein [Acidobacteriia bacterium]|nr:glycosyltransferase family 4 protein [Terriglobia bacterium]
MEAKAREIVVNGRDRPAIVFGATAGVGGLGHSIAAGIAAASEGSRSAFALGPGATDPWPLPPGPPAVEWIRSPRFVPRWMSRYTWLRWKPGRVVLMRDRGLGQWAAREVQRLRPTSCYLFTQVALETLEWARREGVPTVLDNPNGHIRNFRQVCERESQRWFGRSFAGHPVASMVDRVEQEYESADRIRVYSEWGRASMTAYGVPADKVHVVRQTVNLQRFRPADQRPAASGPLRICYVGSLDLRKGFVYLLRAIRALGPAHFHLRIVGATGDRHCAALFAKERVGLNLEVIPGDPIPAYRHSELLVIPTIEDGLPFVLVEGLACGLPVIVTDQAGAAECVQPERSGWVVPAAQVEPLACALEQALRRRSELPEMGRQGRAAVEQYAGPAQLRQLADWVHRESAAEVLH